MADQKVARHNCDLPQIYDYFQNELESRGFVFKATGKYAFQAAFDEKIPCLALSSSKKTNGNVRPRAMYVIYPNYNQETGEYWPCLKAHKYGVAEEKFFIHFADYYNREIKPNQTKGYIPPKKDPEELKRQAAEIERNKQERIKRQENEAKAALIAVRLEWKRAQFKITDSFHNPRTNQVQTYERQVQKLQYFQDKGLESYGAKIMMKHDFTEEEAKKEILIHMPDAADNPTLMNDTLENVMEYQRRNINFEAEFEGGKNGFSLRKARALTVVPLINFNNEIVNVQRIDHHFRNKLNPDTKQYEKHLSKSKMFYSGMPTKEAFLPISSDPDKGYERFNPNADAYLIAEGWATSISKRKALDSAIQQGLIDENFRNKDIQVLAAYSKSNIPDLALKLREINPKADIYLGYDNDAQDCIQNGTNPGLQEACNNFSVSGILGDPAVQSKIRTTLPPIFKERLSASDWDDCRLHLGVDRLGQELAKALNSAHERAVNNQSETTYLIGRYNRQREAYALDNTDVVKNNYEVNYGIVLTKLDMEHIELKARVERTKQLVQERKETFESKNANAPQKDQATIDKEKPVYKLPSFSEQNQKIEETLRRNTSSDIKSFKDILATLDVNEVQNEVLKVVATKDGFESVKSGEITFNNVAIESASKRSNNLNDMPNTFNQFNHSVEPLPKVDTNEIPPHSPNNGIDHQSYDKKALFTAFWVHSSEMFKASQLLKIADLTQDQLNLPDVATAKLESSNQEIKERGPSIAELLVVSATDSEYRESVLSSLKELEDAHPEWKHIKAVRSNITERTMAFDQAQYDQLQIRSNIIGMVVNKITSNEKFENIQVQLSDILTKNSAVAMDRMEKFELVSGIMDTMAGLQQAKEEPLVFERINNFFERFEPRIDDLIKKEGLEMYGLNKPKPPNYDHSSPSFQP